MATVSCDEDDCVSNDGEGGCLLSVVTRDQYDCPDYEKRPPEKQEDEIDLKKLHETELAKLEKWNKVFAGKNNG